MPSWSGDKTAGTNTWTAWARSCCTSTSPRTTARPTSICRWAPSPRSTTDWPAKIAKLKATGYDGTITLEVFSPQREHLLLSRDLLRKWWEAAP